MKSEEIKSVFKRVTDEVESSASQLEQEVKTKVATVRDDTVKKFSGVVS
jgi:gas vesicle protein